LNQAKSRLITCAQAKREILSNLLRPGQCDEVAAVYEVLAGGIAQAETIRVPHLRLNTCGMWHQCHKHAEKEFYPPSQFEALLTEALDSADPEKIVQVYMQVMWVNAYPDATAGQSSQGVRVEDEMERFQCKQCGNCCLGLQDAYDTIVLPADIERWREQGRGDILAYVDQRSGLNRAWIHPRTGDVLQSCPWLKKQETTQKYECSIHATKPKHCADYPHTKRHAFNTGCSGFKA